MVHNVEVKTNIDRYRANKFGMQCCALKKGNSLAIGMKNLRPWEDQS
jgi:hypothetical protein